MPAQARKVEVPTPESESGAQVEAVVPFDQAAVAADTATVAENESEDQEKLAHIEAEVAAAQKPPAHRYFESLLGITDGANHYGTGDHFVGSDSLIAHHERTGGMDGARKLYHEISEAQYERHEAERTAAIQDVDLPPAAPTVNQVGQNMFGDGIAASSNS